MVCDRGGGIYNNNNFPAIALAPAPHAASSSTASEPAVVAHDEDAHKPTLKQIVCDVTVLQTNQLQRAAATLVFLGA